MGRGSAGGATAPGARRRDPRRDALRAFARRRHRVPLSPRNRRAPRRASRAFNAPNSGRDTRRRDRKLVHFPVGPAGTHAITNDCDEPVRYLMISTLRSPNVTEYPDTRQLAVTAATKNQFGEELHETWNLDEPYAG